MTSLTTEQSQVLTFLQNQPQAAVYGCAGSGKTLLAVMIAQERALQGEKVLLLCRNPYLAESLRQRAQGSSLEVQAFPDFVRAVIASVEKPDVFQSRLPSKWRAPWTQYEAPTRQELNLALDILYQGGSPYRAVIVDEGQDFETDWWEVVNACLPEDGTGRMVVFLDDNPRGKSFDAQRRFIAQSAPVSLQRNCRSAGEIEALVRQLHAGETLSGLRAGEQGEVGEWLYTTPEELFEQLRRALLAAEQRLPLLKDVVVLSAESAPGRQSIFAGYRIDSPRLHTSPPGGALEWQAAVLRYLQGLGLLESDLSSQSTPGADDVRRVNKFCMAYAAAHRRALARQPSAIKQGSLRWHIDGFGWLSLRSEQSGSDQLPPVDLVRFFGSADWAATLPPAQRGYRLAPPERWGDYPTDQCVRLVDLPAFSGLEAEGIIFVLHNYFASDRDQLLALLYQASSRAKSLLYIVSTFSILESLKYGEYLVISRTSTTSR